MTRLIGLARASALLLGSTFIALSWAGGAAENTVAQPIARGSAGDGTAFASGRGVPDEPAGFDAALPDLVVSAPSPDNGASSPPFCMGQAVDWHTTVTNQGPGDADTTYLGYYIGTSATDFGNRVNSDATGALAPYGGSSAEHEIHTFTAADAGTRFANVWADYADDLEEEDENNNKNSYGPFEVVAVPPAPLLVAPPNGGSTCDTIPTFSWGSVAGATSYRIQVNGSPDFSSPDIDETTSGTSYTPATGLGPGPTYWRVRASSACGDGAWSPTWSFSVLTIPGTPGLIAPSDGSIVHDEAPTFVWGSVSGASAYRIQVAEDSGFTSPTVDETTSSTTFSPASALANNATYHWRVGASNDCGSGAWSPAWQFTMDAGCPTPPATALSSPADGSSTCDPTPALIWEAASGATSYRIQVDDDPGLSSPVINVTTSSTSHTPGTALSPGTYHWRGRASNLCGEGSWSSVWSFTVLSVPAKPGLASPANGSTVTENTPTFSWSTITEAATYRIQVADNVSFSSPMVDVTTSDTAYVPGSGLADDTTYYWRVRASNACGNGSWSTVWQFTVDIGCPVPSQPSLVSPTDGSGTCESRPTFNWNAVTGATSYRIQVDDDPGLSSPVINVTTSSTSHTPGTALSPGTYHWRGRASNLCGEGSWSSIWSFTVLSVPAKPGLASPANGSTVTENTPTFSWSTISEAATYRIQVADNVSFSSPMIDVTTSDTAYVPGSGLADDTTYYWRVRASNACGNGSWSTVWHFTVDIGCPVPSQPSLVSPTDGSGTCESRPTFNWNAVTGATSYRIQVDDAPGFSSPNADQTTVSTSVTLGAALSPGIYYWRVRASNSCETSPWSATWGFTVMSTPGTLSLSSPPNDSTVHDDTPTFSWSLASEAGLYRIQVDDNANFGSPAIDETAPSTSFIPASGLPDSPNYHWRVQAVNACGAGAWSDAWRFAVDTSCPTPPAPQRLTPADGSSTCENKPTFSWGSVTGATSYRIQVDNGSGFGSPEVNQTTSGTSHTPEERLSPGSYYWRVQGSNTCGDGSWSLTGHFTIQSVPLASSLVSPPNGSNTDDTTPSFEWTSISEADAYRLQVDKDVRFPSPAIDHTTPATSYIPGTALTPNTYYARVQASNECGDGPWSNNDYSFTINGPQEAHLVYLPITFRHRVAWNAYYEDNDHWLMAYGPLVPSRIYWAFPDDVED